MLEKLKYKNHMNEVFDFGKNGIFVNMNDLHDYEWSVTKRGNRISAFDYTVSKRKLPVVIVCKTEEEGLAARNKLMEITEKDVLAMQHGKIIIGDYYFKCFVTKSQKSDYLTNKRYMQAELTLTTDFPYWVKETTFTFGKLDGNSDSGQMLDFSFDYPHDYFSTIGHEQINNTGFVGSNFRMIIYGACTNPVVYINGHKYQVNCGVASGEYLTIDSVAKTIILVKNDGTTVNHFKNRSRDSYVFEKIPAGSNNLSWDGNFGVDVIMMEERSEPKWT